MGRKLLSKFIKELQDKLDKYGDGEVYVLGECAEHEIPFVGEEVENECVWNPEINDCDWITKEVKYRIWSR